MDLIPRRFYLDDIFDDLIIPRKEQNMKCDIYEKDGNYHIELDVPGFTKDEIKIEFKNEYLTITAEKSNETEEKDENKKYICRERNYGKYVRTFHLGKVNQENIDAEFKNGILKIVVPKKENVEDKKIIEIK